ncbi:hypothetical protein MD484_g6340, partial [Candolleomyces efflorescens]
MKSNFVRMRTIQASCLTNEVNSSSLIESLNKKNGPFEGDEYERLLVTVHPLTPFGSLNTPQGGEGDSGLLPQHASSLPPISELPEGVEAHTYGFQDIRWLEPTLWSFDDFVKKCAWKWYGGVQNPWTDTATLYVEKVDAEEPEVEKRRAAMTADAIVRA